jgi:hypothetical protein
MPSRDSKSLIKIASLETKIDLLKESTDGISVELKEMNKTLSAQAEDLKFHIESVRLAREQNDLLKQDMDTRLAPIQKHVIQVNFLGKMMLVFVAFPAAVYYVAQIIRMLMGKI